MALNWNDFLQTECCDLSTSPWLDTPSSNTSLYAAQVCSAMPVYPSERMATYTPQNAHLLPSSVAFSTSGHPAPMSSNAYRQHYEAGHMFESTQPMSSGINKHHAPLHSPLSSDRSGLLAQAAASPRRTVAGVTGSSLSHSQPVTSSPMDLDFHKGFSTFEVTTGASTQGTDPLSSPTNKRKKNNSKAKAIYWTSPICPDNDQELSPVTFTCSGGSVPSLFATHGAMSNMSMDHVPVRPRRIGQKEGAIESQLRSRKRSESAAYLDEEASPKGRADYMPINQSAYMGEVQKLPRASRRLPHYQVERKYRESLNVQLENLRHVIPTLQQGQEACDGHADVDNTAASSKPSKAVILASATAYVKQIEEEKRVLLAENAMLRQKVKACQGRAKCEDCSLMQNVREMKLGKVK